MAWRGLEGTHLYWDGLLEAKSFKGDGSLLVNLPAAGNDTEVQYNDAGSFGASSKLTFNGNDLTVGTGVGDQILVPYGDKNNPPYSFAVDMDMGYGAEANSLYLTIGGVKVIQFQRYVSQAFSRGTKTSPFYSFFYDSNVGMFSPTTDALGFTAGGIEFLRLHETTQNEFIVNELGVDIDFRIESDTDTHAFFLEGSSGNIGIGVADPHSTLEVAGAISSATLNVTASSDNLDVSGVNTLFINITGDIILGGLQGGVNGQTLNIVMVGNFVNHLTIEHAEGVGTQDFINHLAVDELISHGGAIYICNGTDWYDCSHSRHV